MTLHRHRLDRPRPRMMLGRCHFSEMVTLNQTLLTVGYALGLSPHHSAVAVSWTHVFDLIRLVKIECAVPAHENVPHRE